MSAQRELEKMQAMRAELESESRSLKEQQRRLENDVISLEEKITTELLKKEKTAVEELRNRNKIAKDAIAELEVKKEKLENKFEVVAETPEAPVPEEETSEEDLTEAEEADKPVEAVSEEADTEECGITITAIDDEMLVEENEALNESSRMQKKRKRRFF